MVQFDVEAALRRHLGRGWQRLCAGGSLRLPHGRPSMHAEIEKDLCASPYDSLKLSAKMRRIYPGRRRPGRRAELDIQNSRFKTGAHTKP